MFGITLSGVPFGNLVLYRTCVHSLNHTVEDCQSFLNISSIDHSAELENDVQQYATIVKTVESVITALGPAILSLFMGVWSDKHGRKPLILWPLLGMTISAIFRVIFSLVESLGPWWILVPAVPFSLFGGFTIMATGAYCYSTDISTTEDRSLRLLVVVIAIAIATTVGGVVTPHLLDSMSYNWHLSLVCLMYVIGFFITKYYLKESLPEAVKGNIYTIFNFSHPKEMMKYTFIKKPNYVRAILLLTVGAFTFSVFSESGVNALMYMNVRTKIQWSMTDFTTSNAINSVASFAACVVGVVVLQRILNVSDLNFVSIAFFTTVVDFTIKALATVSWHVYLAAAIGLLGSMTGPLLRSFLTKTVARTDTAKVFGLLGFTEAFCPLLSPLVYNALYTQTINTFPGAIMILAASLNLLSLILILFVQILTRKVSSKVDSEEV